MRNRLVIAALTVLVLSAAACAAPVRQAAIEEPAPEVVDPVGVYDFTTLIDGNTVAGVLTLRRNADGGLSATVSTPVTGDIPINSVIQTDNTLHMRANMGGEALRMTVTVGETGILTGGWMLSSGAGGGVDGTRRDGNGRTGVTEGPARVTG